MLMEEPSHGSPCGRSRTDVARSKITWTFRKDARCIVAEFAILASECGGKTVMMRVSLAARSKLDSVVDDRRLSGLFFSRS